MCVNAGSGGLWPTVPDCLISRQKVRFHGEQLGETGVGQGATRASDTRSPRCKNRSREKLHCRAVLESLRGRTRPAKVRRKPQHPNHPTQNAKQPKPAARVKVRPDRADFVTCRAGVTAPVLCKGQQDDRSDIALRHMTRARRQIHFWSIQVSPVCLSKHPVF